MYEIKVLSSKEFNELPYENIDDSLGFADVRNKRVFVRDTGVHELNRYLISHEIDHLVEEHATDEDENGIRHAKKKGPKLFKDILLPLFTGFSGDGSFNPLGILGAFGGGKEEQPQQQQASSGSYDPLQGLMNASGGFPSGYSPSNMSGSYGSPLNLFPTSGSYSPANVPDSISGASITNGLGSQNSELSPELLAKLKAGNYDGRLVF